MLRFKELLVRNPRPASGQRITFTLSGNVIKDQFGKAAEFLLTRSSEEYRLISSPDQRTKELCLVPLYFFQDGLGPHMAGIVYNETNFKDGKRLDTDPISHIQMKDGWMRRGGLVSSTGTDPADRFWKLKGIMLG